LEAEFEQIHGATAKFDLTLILNDDGGELQGDLNYNTDLFDASTVKRLLRHFEHLLTSIAADVTQRISELPLLDADEQRQLLVEWNDTRRVYAEQGAVHELFETQSAAAPQALAVSFAGEQLSYGELNSRANRLAHHLRELGVGPDVLVAICVERSTEMIVALLAVLKAGGAYLPLDPQYPRERLAFMLEDAQAGVLLTQEHLRIAHSLEGAQVVCLDAERAAIAAHSDENPPHLSTGDHLAYVIYTSGSTGRPNGVQISHGALLNLVHWHREAFAVTAQDCATQLAGVAFDASVWEIWPYLTASASLHLPDEETRLAPLSLRDWLVAEGITVSFLPTPLAERLMVLEWPRETRLRLLLTGGEQLHLYPDAGLPFKLVNNYGPTENSVVTTSGEVRPATRTQGPPNIGRPIANTQVFLLDRDLRPVPPGAVGELYLAGAGLARGYLRRPDLTAARFIPHPFSSEPGARLYRTGDLARYLPNSSLAFEGRVDAQVKLRGFRIEPGEIETTLDGHPAVSKSLVVLREDRPGYKRLVAYVVEQAGVGALSAELRDYLRQRLPNYMLPEAFVMLDAFPLTPNGKIDRRRLPAPELAQAQSGTAFVAPGTPTEQAMAKVWAEVLGLERVGLHDNFFEIGGHSLLAAQLVWKISETAGIEIPLHTLFECSTVEQLSRVVERRRDEIAEGGGAVATDTGTTITPVNRERYRRTLGMSGAKDELPEVVKNT
jgi:amino acid adenylation domain-containing protein